MAGDWDEGTHTWSFTVADLQPLRSPRGRRRSIPSPEPEQTMVVLDETDEEHFDFSELTTDTVPDIARLLAEQERGEPPPLPPATEKKKTDGAVKGQTVVDRYMIEESIAVGGMGRVHKVKHLHLDKRFALKEMHEIFSSDKKMRARFLQEARLASGLSHSNIVSVVDFGEDPKLGAFMVMELVEGETLSRRLRNKERLPLRMACEIILQIADALHYIHKQGIVHGDIKPDNILLRRAGRSELRRWKICLLDFGLARPQLSDSDEEHIEGTPAYMAPEVICGEPMGEGADIYSLGILSYQLVTGQTPFQGGLRELMTQHLKQEPKPLTEVVGEPVDERLEALIMKALQKDPKNRQNSMAAFLFEMKTLMDMLGFGSRRNKKAAMRRATESDIVEVSLGKLAFEQCGFGIAVIEFGGAVALANTAFSHFFRRGQGNSMEGLTVMDPRFIRIHPQLPADLAQVQQTGQALRRLLTFNDANGQIIELIFNLAVLDGAQGKLILSIVPL